MTNNEMQKLMSVLLNTCRNPKDVNMFYARYYAEHVGGIYETVDEAMKAWHND